MEAQLLLRAKRMKLAFTIEQDETTGVFVASWDDPQGGGITTQGESVEELLANMREAVACHFGKKRALPSVALHFATDPILQFA